MRFRFFVGLVSASGITAAAIACGGSASDIVGQIENSDSGASRGSSANDSGASSSSRDDAGTSSDASIDTTTDEHNCGAIGHDCLGATCSGSLCAPTKFASKVGWFVIDGDAANIYAFTSDTALSVAPTSNPSAMTLVANLDKTCVAAIRELYTTGSYVVLQCDTELQTVNKSTHAIATVTFATNGSPWALVGGNDTDLYWFDANPYLWSAPTTGGAPKQVFDNWIPSSIQGTGDGFLAIASDGFGEELGLYHFKNGSAEPTFLADTPDDSTPAELTASHTTAFGATQAETSACDTTPGTSTFWSALRDGGTESTIATLPFRAGQMVGDTNGVVIAEQCENISGTSYTGDRNIWRAPLESGQKPLLLAKTIANFGQIGTDSKYVYFTDKSDGNVDRVAR